MAQFCQSFRDLWPIFDMVLNRWEKIALVVWFCILMAICGRVLVSPRVHSVYGNFADASRNWIAGADLYRVYDGEQRRFVPSAHRYGPLVAVLFLPFICLPDWLGGILWRLLNAAIYLFGLAWWSRAAVPLSLTGTQRAALFLLVVPLSIGSLNNGQSNGLVTGFLLVALAAAAAESWNVAGLYASLACLLKVYPIAIGLLLALLYPRKLAARLLLALVVGLALPFVFQQPPYVLRQYCDWFLLLWNDDRKEWPLLIANRDFWLLCRVWHIPLSAGAYLAVQLSAALAVAGTCLASHRAAWPKRKVLMLALALGTCWMMLFGPATESSTYMILGPALAWTVLEAWLLKRATWIQTLLVLSFGLFFVSWIAGAFPGTARVHALGLQPLATLLLLTCVLGTNLPNFRRVPAFQPVQRSVSVK